MSQFTTRWFYVPLKTYDESGSMDRKGNHNPRLVEFAEFARQLEAIYSELDANGFDVINVLPLAIGSSEMRQNAGGGYLGEPSFSPTRGAIVVGKKR